MKIIADVSNTLVTLVNLCSSHICKKKTTIYFLMMRHIYMQVVKNKERKTTERFTEKTEGCREQKTSRKCQVPYRMSRGYITAFYCVRPILKIFLFPLTQPCFSGMGRSVGKLFFLTSQIPNPLNLIVNSLNIGNKTKCTKDAN